MNNSLNLVNWCRACIPLTLRVARSVKDRALKVIHSLLIASLMSINVSGVLPVRSPFNLDHSLKQVIPEKQVATEISEDHAIGDQEGSSPPPSTTFQSMSLQPSYSTGIRTGRVIFEGPLESVLDPIAAVQGHTHVMQLAFQIPGCGNCGVTGYIGPVKYPYPNNILKACFSGYGPAQQCSTEPFTSPGSELFIDIWAIPWVPPESGIVRVIDLDMSPGIPLNSTLSDCLPKDGQGDQRECQINGSSNSQGYAGDPINTFHGGYHSVISDMSINTSAGPLHFQRTYSSRAAENALPSTLGHGWTHNHDTRLIFPDDPGGEEFTIWFKAHTANLYRFQITGDGSYAALPGVLLTCLINLDPQDATYSRIVLNRLTSSTRRDIYSPGPIQWEIASIIFMMKLAN